MGTRNLIMVQYKKKIVVAQYGQFDGYPSCQGVRVLEFLQNVDLDKFKAQLKKIKFVKQNETEFAKKVNKIFTKVERAEHKLYKEKRFRDATKLALEQLTPRERFLYTCFARETSANILKTIYNADVKEIKLMNDINFASDSLFCEWAYLINLDNNTLEVYRGFNKQPLTPEDRFHKMKIRKMVADCPQYYQIKLLKTYRLDRLPAEKGFISTLEALAKKRDK